MSKPDPYRLLTFAEIRARPPQPVLVPGCIAQGDHIVVTGDRSYAVALRAALGHDTHLLVAAGNYTLAQRWDLLKRADEIRQGGNGPAVIVFLPADTGPLFDWYQQFPDVVLVATAPDRAEVRKLRNHDDQGKALVIRNGIARVIRA